MNDDLDLGITPPADEELEDDDELEKEDEELEDDEEDIEKIKPISAADGDVSLEDLGEEEIEKSNMSPVDDEGNPQF